MSVRRPSALLLGWIASAGLATAVRVWNAIFGPLFYGYDAWGHISYVFFLDMYHALPYADQGWSYFHPPLYYLLGWALMQASDPDVLVKGLSLLGSAASLGVAALAGWIVHRAFPERPGLALLGFTGIAFLPVHLYTSPMPGNEMTATFLAACVVAAHLRNELRETPTRKGDVATGVLAGLAMLSKFTDLVPVLSVFALTGLRWLRAGRARPPLTRPLARAVAIAIPMLVLAGPWYARNVVEFGTPFMTSADVHDVHRIQAGQPPGDRPWTDFFRFSPKVFEDSVPSAPHMIHTVWPNTYLNVWFDTFRESQLPFPRNLVPHPFIHQLTILFGLLGLVPTLVAVYGALVAARRILRDPGSTIELAMWILGAATLAAFVLFAVRIPTWAALKASYLLNLSLPFAFFLAAGTLDLGRRRRWLGVVVPGMVGLEALAASYVFATGRPPGLMRRDFDNMQMASVRAYFGDFAPTLADERWKTPKRSYLEARAAAELFSGNPGVARRLYLRAGRMKLDDPDDRPWWTNRLAVATALDDQPERARRLLDEALAEKPLPELLVNRAALRAREGDFAGAEKDLRDAIARAPDLPPAWSDLAVVLAREGHADEAAAARARAEKVAWMAPRGFPYGVGNGFLYASGAGQRFMLVLEDEGADPTDPYGGLVLQLYRPPRTRTR